MQSLPFLEATNMANRRVVRVSNQLLSLSSAFRLTSNEALADTLSCLAIDLTDAAEEIGNAVSARIDDDFKQAQTASVTVLRAVLAGTEIGKAAPQS